MNKKVQLDSSIDEPMLGGNSPKAGKKPILKKNQTMKTALNESRKLENALDSRASNPIHVNNLFTFEYEEQSELNKSDINQPEERKSMALEGHQHRTYSANMFELEHNYSSKSGSGSRKG